MKNEHKSERQIYENLKRDNKTMKASLQIIIEKRNSPYFDKECCALLAEETLNTLEN